MSEESEEKQMKVKAEMLVLGTEVIASKKDAGKSYNQINFLDGSYPCNILTESAEVFSEVSKLAPLTPVIAELDLRLGRYTNCKVISFQLVKKG